MKNRVWRWGAAGLALLLAAAGWREARAVDAGRINSAVNRLVSNPGDGGAKDDLQNICFEVGRPGAEAERVTASMAMLSKLGPRTPVDARVWMLWQIERIGRAEVVGGLSQLLMDREPLVREGARRALENNPSPQAGKALVKVLRKAKDAEWRVALINAIGGHGGEDALDDLVELLDAREKEDEPVAVAAAAALGRIGGTDAAKALSSAMKKGSQAFRAAAADAYLACADRFLAEGSFSEAAAIYKKLYSAKGSKLLMIAGMQGIAAVQAAKASGKRERKAKPSSAKGKKAKPAPREPKVAPEVLAEWDGKLLERVRKALKAGKKPSFHLTSMRTSVRVAGVTEDGELKVSAQGMQLSVPMSRLVTADKRNLATAVAGTAPTGNAIAAFYCLALGDERKAGPYLRKAGELAGEVRKLFE